MDNLVKEAYYRLLFAIFGERFPETEVDMSQIDDLSKQITAVLDTIWEERAELIKLRFGISDGIPKTISEIAKVLDVGEFETKQIEIEAMKQLRHPSRTGVLRPFLPEED